MESSVVQLQPAGDVDRIGKQFVAHTGAPWLRLCFGKGVPAGRWIRLTYRGSYFDPLVRPIVRFITDDESHDVLAAAPLFGRAHWTGRVPDRTRDILISPVDGPGPFGFEVETCQPVSWAALVVAAAANDRRRTLEAIGAFCIGRRGEAQRLLGAAVRSVALARYHEWRRARRRSLDQSGLDAPRADWSKGPHQRFVVGCDPADAVAIRVLHDSLAQQPYDRWSLALIAPDPAALANAIDPSLARQTRLIGADAPVDAVIDDLDDGDLVCALSPTDRLPPECCAIVAEHAIARQDAAAFYGDEDAIDATGRHTAPRLKPDWSPVFEAAAGYVGGPLFVRRRLVRQSPMARSGELVAQGSVGRLLGSLPASHIVHVKRVLLSRTAPLARNRPPGPAPSVSPVLTRYPRATVVIPNKDQPDLLTTCLRGLRQTAGADCVEIVIVDNGSTDPETLRLYEKTMARDSVRLCHRPGPFNFAFLCNEGAKAAQAPLLVFLNNDIEVTDGGWLDRLLPWTARPDIGAVGVRLLYPSRRLQHGGIVLGLAGTTGHVDRGVAGDDPGYLCRRTSPHEVAAVTAACLAVEKRKFDTIGGFDADHLPVELNDVDLCLRLARHGWRTIMEPGCVLIHHESASRGSWRTQRAKYANEHAAFRARWHEMLRDDPYFHPALTLDTVRTALG
jgi:GT2 family glycosyltransferase